LKYDNTSGYRKPNDKKNDKLYFAMDDLDRSEHDLNKKLFKDNEDIEFDKDDVNTFSQTHFND
jgi:hypothetical protein